MTNLYFLEVSFIDSLDIPYKFGWCDTLQKAQEKVKSLTPSVSEWTVDVYNNYSATAYINAKPVKWSIYVDEFSSKNLFNNLKDTTLAEFLKLIYSAIETYDSLVFKDFGSYIKSINNEQDVCKLLGKIMFIQAERFNNYLRHVYEFMLLTSPSNKVRILCLTALLRFGNDHTLKLLEGLSFNEAFPNSKLMKVYYSLQEKL